ncbi:acylphosphatase [Companilactobacillus sp.]|jgi:acylphosphatase|uniref:acylphosphatase n=1 Tax=Companilactobacillus sp. TaxID=2767905 RepID=UPI0025BCC363|nr:acylphosphatase [Companilactobacillus sp.]MCH4007998.1 acylphosphatase [Companilactobacillus sp.]MCH4051823.1 acylphosphatase [Companilactobacillus sp.]MCH4075941.1 acylphosphatase [Companilactobacillus sp.]MCH4124516.1 acylphosphatase [Companilactobacillus sp.]MCH4132521.1 acylphosphatase [Companilactobacillus sp.]
MKHLSMHVYGLVQGVGFRYSTLQVAIESDVTGTVENEMDGSVKIEAEGEEMKLYSFLTKIRQSPSPFAKVKTVDYSFSDNLENYKKFRVIG